MFLIIIDGYTVAKKELTAEQIKKYNESGIAVMKA